MNRAFPARLFLVASLFLLVVPPAPAQVFTGRIEVVVSDATGVLPGVLVGLSGPQAGTFVTAHDGAARFLKPGPRDREPAQRSLGGAAVVLRR